jgi:hypothetical protein
VDAPEKLPQQVETANAGKRDERGSIGNNERSQLETIRRGVVFRQISRRIMKRYLTMSRKLHEFLDPNSGQLRRASQRDAAFTEQFQREELGGAARRRTLWQAGQRENIFRYFNGHVCHANTLALYQIRASSRMFGVFRGCKKNSLSETARARVSMLMEKN